MMKRFLLVGLSVVTLGFGAMILSPQMVAADAKSEVCKGINASTGGGCTDTSNSVQRIVDAVLNIFSVVIGILAVIMIIWGGFKYVTAAGDANNITSAKNTIIYAIVGIVIAALSQFLVNFVLDRVK
jgi:hypothetical protein